MKIILLFRDCRRLDFDHWQYVYEQVELFTEGYEDKIKCLFVKGFDVFGSIYEKDYSGHL